MAGLPAKRFRKRRKNSQPPAWLPDFRALRRRVVQLRISSCYQPLKILHQLARQRAVSDAIQIHSGPDVKVLQLFGFGWMQSAVRPAFERCKQRFEVAPARPRLRLKSLEIQDHSR